jgi:type IV pilus biogenesis protein CpaD/CtpE
MAYDRLSDLEDKCDSIDAMVFTGDLLFIKNERETLKRFVDNWSKAIAHHEQMEKDGTYD